jgi:hypothetical protein
VDAEPEGEVALDLLAVDVVAFGLGEVGGVVVGGADADLDVASGRDLLTRK